ncbi:hypothetical protein HGM15179_021922 [Zosterops borbonicus]|uniref:Uncharacterized protein n=1 Tax=Zosterops borbonicus TaxID=364589 RepID=A0A8K1FWS9_9PASS|nr:hypothetical protein HGM15179_021922 [Zosterops borbonicus]
MVSLFLVFTAFVISNVGHIRPQRTLLAFVSGIFFILSGEIGPVHSSVGIPRIGPKLDPNYPKIGPNFTRIDPEKIQDSPKIKKPKKILIFHPKFEVKSAPSTPRLGFPELAQI